MTTEKPYLPFLEPEWWTTYCAEQPTVPAPVPLPAPFVLPAPPMDGPPPMVSTDPDTWFVDAPPPRIVS